MAVSAVSAVEAHRHNITKAWLHHIELVESLLVDKTSFLGEVAS